jgi:outer membrane immunogenic protein
MTIMVASGDSQMSKRLIFLFAVTALALCARGFAFAADMVVKAPPLPAAPVYSWTGFYGGLNMGVSFGSALADVNYFAPSTIPSTVCGPAGFALCITGSDTVHMNGPIGGVQAGYNWQSGNYLLGLEADFQGTGQSGTRDFATSFNNSTGFFSVDQGTAAISLKERMPWFGTVRGRIGLVANRWLVYATGGLAYGQIEVDSSASASAGLRPFNRGGTPTCNAPVIAAGTCPVWGFSGSVTQIGWAVGGGTELVLGGNWTAKFEYLFVDLGSFNTTFAGLGGCFGVVIGSMASCAPTAPGTGTIHSTITDNIVRAGLNYQFH